MIILQRMSDFKNREKIEQIQQAYNIDKEQISLKHKQQILTIVSIKLIQ